VPFLSLKNKTARWQQRAVFCDLSRTLQDPRRRTPDAKARQTEKPATALLQERRKAE
jgi:hypothetical protein